MLNHVSFNVSFIWQGIHYTYVMKSYVALFGTSAFIFAQ